MSIPTTEIIEAALESEEFNLAAANRKGDTINVMVAFLLIALIKETRESNELLAQIRDKIEDD